jgi:hypothetical protein
MQFKKKLITKRVIQYYKKPKSYKRVMKLSEFVKLIKNFL